MENELQILQNIQKSSFITQRDISKLTGISLGNVNLIIKKLIEKGMVKVEKLNTRSMKYTLTSKGIKEKAEATYKYIIESYKFINGFHNNMEDRIKELNEKKYEKVILFGPQDEICNVFKSTFNRKGILYNCISDKDVIKNTRHFENTIVFVWHPDFESYFQASNFEYVNLLNDM